MKAATFLIALASLGASVASGDEKNHSLTVEDRLVERLIEGIRLPSIEFKDDSIASACMELQKEVNRILALMGEEGDFKIVLRNTADERVSFRLENVVVDTVLHVATEQSNLRYWIEDGVVVVGLKDF